jgi:hypothetical protein
VPALAALAALGVALARPEWRFVAVCLLGLLGALRSPALLRLPLALLAAQGALAGGALGLVGGLGLGAFAGAGARRPRRAAAALLLGAFAGVASTSARTGLSAALGVWVLTAAWEARPGARGLVAAALLVGGAQTGWALWGWREARQARLTDAQAAALEARCQVADVAPCVAELRLKRIHARWDAQDWAAAQQLARALPEPGDGPTERLRAELLRRAGQAAAGRAKLNRLAQERPDALSPWAFGPDEGLGWARALVRNHRDAQARRVLDALSSPEALALRALVEQGAAREGPALVDAPAGERGMLAVWGRYSTALRLEGAETPGRCLKRGETFDIELDVELDTGLAYGEDMWIFLHADGPGPLMAFDRALDAPGRLPAQRWESHGPATIPADAVPGRYRLRAGFYDLGSGLRLHPEGAPGHISFLELGLLEVCP